MGVFSIFPERASTAAGEVDALYGFLLVVGVGMTALIFFFVFFFAIKYRRKSPDDPAPTEARDGKIEKTPIRWSLSVGARRDSRAGT